MASKICMEFSPNHAALVDNLEKSLGIIGREQNRRCPCRCTSIAHSQQNLSARSSMRSPVGVHPCQAHCISATLRHAPLRHVQENFLERVAKEKVRSNRRVSLLGRSNAPSNPNISANFNDSTLCWSSMPTALNALIQVVRGNTLAMVSAIISMLPSVEDAQCIFPSNMKLDVLSYLTWQPKAWRIKGSLPKPASSEAALPQPGPWLRRTLPASFHSAGRKIRTLD